MENTKQCPYCKETVTADAKKCRYCHEWLKFCRRSTGGRIFLALALLIVIYAIILTPALIFFPSEFFNNRKEFDKSVALNITEHYSALRDGKTVIIGKLENQDEDAWRGIKIEAEFFDRDMNFIDKWPEYISQTLQPGDKENFILRSPYKDASDFQYDTYVISVTSAWHKK